MKSIYIYLTGLIVAVAFSGCTSNKVEIPLQPAKTQAFEEIKVDTKSPEEITEELKKLHNLPPEEYYIAAGDRFDFKVYDNSDLNITGLIVTPDGYVSIGLIGPVKIGGLTIPAATKLIEDKLKKYIRFPSVSIIPTHINSSTFTIVGKVGNPGRYPIRNNPRITDAIALAQGLAIGEFDGDTVEMADLKHAYIARKGKILPVDFDKAIKKGNWLNDIPLRDGDYIYIPSSMNESVYVLGEVYEPGYLGYKESMTILKAIAFAKGRKDTASWVSLVIRGSLVKPKIYKIDVDKILKGEAFDFELRPNDIVYVPKDGISKYNVIVQKILPTLEALNLLAGPFGNTGLSINTSGGGGN